jgi:restriction endonuclease Mrr
VSLVDWALGPELVRTEADALIAVERLRDAARRQLLRRINELPQPAFTELLLMLLERLGISSLRTARRPGLPQGEIHLAGVARRAGEEIKVAVVLKRGGEVGRERVIEIRGALHHYGPATSAWIVTTGNVLSGAREEAAQGSVAPVALIDGTALARLLDEHRVGVRHASVTIPYVDLDLFDALRS